MVMPAPEVVHRAAGALPNISDIRAAQQRIARWIHRTPLLRNSTLDGLAGRQLRFKCELFQRVGAFKFRGACNAVMALSADQAAHGVVTHSSGNHAQALALAARLRGIAATIVMPQGAPAVKRRAVEGYGARVVECAPTLAAREEACEREIARSGAVLIHPYDNFDVIAGQGTVALEIFEDEPEVEAIIAPIGGGGLMSGIAIATRALRPDALILAAEPALAQDAAVGKQLGVRQGPMPPKTIADGLRTALSPRTFSAVRDLVDEVLTVPEEEIVPAMRLLWERAKLMAEPSSAVALAAVLSESFRARQTPRCLAVVLSGGNVDLESLPFQAV